MHDQRRAVLLALVAALLVTPSLAGCLGSAEATAVQHRDTATRKAQAWDQGATLSLVLGVEGNLSNAWRMGSWDVDHDHSYWHRSAQDPHKGDGKTELWLYRFVAPDHPDQAYVVVVDQAGKVLRNGTVPRWSQSGPLGAWSVDSDRAASIAANANQGIAQGTSSSHYGLVLVLSGNHDGHAVWTVAGGGGDANGGGFGIVRIDAVNGTVLSSYGGFHQGG